MMGIVDSRTSVGGVSVLITLHPVFDIKRLKWQIKDEACYFTVHECGSVRCIGIRRNGRDLCR